MTITILLALILSLLTSISQLTHAQNSPQDYIDAHNKARKEVSVGPIEWNHTVAAYAWQYAAQRTSDCSLVLSGGPYGENIAWSSGMKTGTQTVESWVDEKQNYDYNNNSCVSGDTCRLYTQVVWRNSIRLGCAQVRCSSGGTFIACEYDPPGNIVGERPY